MNENKRKISKHNIERKHDTAPGTWPDPEQRDPCCAQQQVCRLRYAGLLDHIFNLCCAHTRVYCFSGNDRREHPADVGNCFLPFPDADLFIYLSIPFAREACKWEARIDKIVLFQQSPEWKAQQPEGQQIVGAGKKTCFQAGSLLFKQSYAFGGNCPFC